LSEKSSWGRKKNSHAGQAEAQKPHVMMERLALEAVCKLENRKKKLSNLWLDSREE
jgi:hypothetical protein